jgi:hypothetical protein
MTTRKGLLSPIVIKNNGDLRMDYFIVYYRIIVLLYYRMEIQNLNINQKKIFKYYSFVTKKVRLKLIHAGSSGKSSKKYALECALVCSYLLTFARIVSYNYIGLM